LLKAKVHTVSSVHRPLNVRGAAVPIIPFLCMCDNEGKKKIIMRQAKSFLSFPCISVFDGGVVFFQKLW
jgi:hypothetical protein